jgi:glycosyltransferase involved in cell wall biosynthesis
VPGIVVEGGVNEILTYVTPQDHNRIPILLYTGALDENSGIGILLDAMRLLAGMELALWIAGKGIYAGLVEEAQRTDSRICYYGYVENSVALQLQQKADVLLCPRLPDGYVTKYTFPSKLFEYLLSGKPCICFRLEGLADDITRILFIPGQNSAEALARKIKEVLSIRDFDPNEQLVYVRNKTWKNQVPKVDAFIKRMVGVS